jgi:hypothetical protein
MRRRRQMPSILRFELRWDLWFNVETGRVSLQSRIARTSQKPRSCTNEGEGSLAAVVRLLREQRERYEADILKSRPFQDAVRYLNRLTSDYLLALTCVRLSGERFSAADHYLVFRFAPHFVESALALQASAREGLQNAARRELRFVLEATIKLSAQDSRVEIETLEDRLDGLTSGRRFKDYVADLTYFDGFETPADANADALSLYSELSAFVHAAVPQFKASMNRSARGEPAGMETVATLNSFNKLAFRVYDMALVRIFHGVGLGIAGDIFTTLLDDYAGWRFHKEKFVGRMSRCFDYKHERRAQQD